jgi:hypothetical protein
MKRIANDTGRRQLISEALDGIWINRAKLPVRDLCTWVRAFGEGDFPNRP